MLHEPIAFAGSAPPDRLDGPRRSWTWAERLALPAVAAGAFVVLLTRPPGIPTWRVLYAEDASRFVLGPARHHTVAELLDPYGGYRHVIPRLLGWAAWVPPLEYASAVMAAGSAAVAVLAVLCLAAGLRRVLPAPWMRLLVVPAVVLTSVMGQEVAANAADLHYVLLLGLVGLSLLRPANPVELAAAGTVAFFFGLSEPMGLLLLPVAFGDAAVRAGRQVPARSRVRQGLLTWGLPTALLLGLLPQLTTLDGRPGAAGPELTAGEILRHYVLDVIGQAISPTLTEGDGGRALSFAAAAVIGPLATAVVAARGSRKHLGVSAFLAACSWLFFVLPVVVNHGVLGRYTAAPAALLVCAVLVLAAGVPARRHLLYACTAAVLITAELASWDVPLQRGLGPSWPESVQLARAQCRSPGTPRTTNVPIRVAPPGWSVTLDCGRLLDH